MNQKGFANTILIVVIVILAGIAGYFVLISKQKISSVSPQSQIATSSNSAVMPNTASQGEISEVLDRYNDPSTGIEFLYLQQWGKVVKYKDQHEIGNTFSPIYLVSRYTFSFSNKKELSLTVTDDNISLFWLGPDNTGWEQHQPRKVNLKTFCEYLRNYHSAEPINTIGLETKYCEAKCEIAMAEWAWSDRPGAGIDDKVRTFDVFAIFKEIFIGKFTGVALILTREREDKVNRPLSEEEKNLLVNLIHSIKFQ